MENLKGTKTEANLAAAFAGESQARNKYTYYASKAKKDGYEQIAALFLETANNEKEHAKIWFKLLHDGIGDTAANLEDAAAGENYEWKRALITSPSCLRRSARSKRSTRSGTASCSRTSKRAASLKRTARCTGSAPTAAISMRGSKRRRFARCVPIPAPISRWSRRIIESVKKTGLHSRRPVFIMGTWRSEGRPANPKAEDKRNGLGGAPVRRSGCGGWRRRDPPG